MGCRECGGDASPLSPEADLPTAMDDVQWLSTAEAARRLGVTARTVYGFIDDGSLVAYRFGRVIRIQAVDLSAFIEACRITPGTLGTIAN